MPDANLHKYLKEIKNYLTCPEEEKRKFLEELESSIDEFLADHPHATEADLVHRFGDPAGIAQSFLQEEDFKEVQEKIRLKGRVIRILSVAILVLTAAAVILGGIFVIDMFSFNHGQYKESIGKGERPENSAILQTY